MFSSYNRLAMSALLCAVLSGCYIVQAEPGTSVTIQQPVH